MIEASNTFYKLERPFKMEGIDFSVRGLVMSINGLGLETVGSCEGHLDGHRNPYPLVGISGIHSSFYPHKLRALEKLLEDYNLNRQIRWAAKYGQEISPNEETLSSFGITHSVIVEFNDSTRIHTVPIGEAELKSLHQSARELASFLAKTHLSRLRRSGGDIGHFRQAYTKAGVELGLLG